MARKLLAGRWSHRAGISALVLVQGLCLAAVFAALAPKVALGPICVRITRRRRGSDELGDLQRHLRNRELEQGYSAALPDPVGSYLEVPCNPAKLPFSMPLVV